MIYSQFKIYESNDFGAPILNVDTGSLINVLNACLVTGYGNKQPAGWLQPVPPYTESYRAAYKQPSGSGFFLYVNDSGPYSIGGLGGPRTAWVTGYETLLGMTSSFGLTASFMGEGTGQFPIPYQPQIITPYKESGSLGWTKAATYDFTPRQWVLFADAYTIYFFVANGLGPAATPWAYAQYAFGDFYSHTRRPDPWNCFIAGRLGDAAQSGVAYDPNDYIHTFTNPNYPFFIARSYSGFSSSMPGQRIGDAGKVANILDTNPPAQGGFYAISSTGNDAYISPLYVGDSNITIRGKFRGINTISANFALLSDGFEFSGSNQDNGKTFRIVKHGPNYAVWVIETSNTVETNDT